MQRQRDNEELRENGETASDADSAFDDDFKLFTVSHTFVLTDALGHTKNCGKNTRKSADAVAEFAVS